MQGMELRHRLCFRQWMCVCMRIGNAFVGNKGEYFLNGIENPCRFGRIHMCTILLIGGIHMCTILLIGGIHMYTLLLIIIIHIEYF